MPCPPTAPFRHPSCIPDGHIKGSQRTQLEWRIFDARYWPGDSLADHLTFALRHERLDLLVLKRILEQVDPAVVEEIVRRAPAGVPNRILWFLYEWLLGKTLDIPVALKMTAVDLLDPNS